MFYVYLLKSEKDNSLYIGYTNDLRKRFEDHNRLKNKSTKSKAPFNLIYYEVYKERKDAKFREKNLKRFANAYSQLKRRLKNSLT